LPEERALPDTAAGEEPDALPFTEGHQPIDGAHAGRERPRDPRTGKRARCGAHDGPRHAVQRRPSVDRLPETVEHAAEQRFAHLHRAGSTRRTHLVVGADPARISERQERRAVVVEADHLRFERSPVPPKDLDGVADPHARDGRVYREAAERLDTAGDPHRIGLGEGVESPAQIETHRAPSLHERSVEEGLELLEEAPLLRVHFLAHLGGELGDELALLLADLLGHLDDDLHELVALAVAAQHRDAFASQAEDLARLRAGRDAHLHPAFERRHVDLRAEHRLGKAHRHRHVHVGALAREERMRLHADPHVEVARGAPTRLAGALHRADRTVLHAGRHLDRHLLDLRHHPVARADRAGLLDAPPRSAAGRARPRDAEEAALVAHLASALARRTAPDSRPWRRAASATRVAGLPARDLDRLLRAERRFFEADLELDLDVAPGPGATAAEDAAEQALEDLADRSEVHLLVGIVTAARLESRVP